jgi:acetoacetate decarboxylase
MHDRTIDAMVPEPLVPNERGIVYLTVTDQHVVRPMELTYREAMLVVPVALGGTAGTYIPVRYVDQTAPLLIGREIFGFPEVEADIAWTSDGEGIRIVVTRDGTTLIELATALGDPLEEIPQKAAGPSFNLELVPSVRLFTTT